MIDPFSQITDLITQICSDLYGDSIKDCSPVIVDQIQERFRDRFNVTTNIAMIIAKHLKVNPSNIAQSIVDKISDSRIVEYCEVVGAGFINMKILHAFWSSVLLDIVHNGASYGFDDIGHGERVNVEFVSTNPTGPMHIGHTRGAIYGDVIARVFAKNGFNVTREYYINDAGAQIDSLVKSALFRYEQALSNNDDVCDTRVPDGLYPGEYLIPVGKKIKDQYGDSLLKMNYKDQYERTKNIVVEMMMDLIRTDLLRLGVSHDVFTSESDICSDGDVDEAFKILNDKNLIFRGILDVPKGKKVDDWEPQEQELFKSTSFGDDADRPLRKSDGTWTYFAPDIGYHYNKYKRGFCKMVLVLGADHKGYAKRISAAVDAISDGNASIDVKLCELVSFIRNGEVVKMSKRSGNFVTVDDILSEVDKDIIRFMMMTRQNDTTLQFDLVKVKEQSAQNPIFYVQYAHSRCCSIIRKAESIFGLDVVDIMDINVDLLKGVMQNREKANIVIKLALYPRVMRTVINRCEPHILSYYLLELVSMFHGLWNAGNIDHLSKLIIENDVNATRANLVFIVAVKSVIASVLDLFGILAMERME